MPAMPVQLLPFPPSYCVVGAYRLITDETLWRPIWIRSRSTIMRALACSLPYLLIAYPITRLYVSFILSRSPFSPTNIHDAAYLGISVIRYTTGVMVLGQMSALLEWALRRQVGKGKNEVYEATVRSRGKGSDFWQPYFEEWSVPPLERAQRNAQRQSFFAKLTSPLLRMVVLKVLLTPLSWIPFLSTIVTAALKSLTAGRLMHKPYFEAKKMTPLQIELFMVERQTEYRTFGFVASILERLPVVGIVFSISNRIGAAMWAHDLEKQQHLYREGTIPRTKSYFSKTALVEPTDLPPSFAGSFPSKKGPVILGKSTPSL